MKQSTNREHVQRVMTMIEHTKLKDVIEASEICFDPDDLETLIHEDKTIIQQYHDDPEKTFPELIKKGQEEVIFIDLC